MRNPFTLGIVRKDDFCKGEKELEDILRFARNGNHIVLFSPRRYGKSSLIHVALDLLGQEGFLTVYIDLFPVTSEQDFISRFSAGIFRGVGRGADPRSFLERTGNLFKRLIPSIEVRPDGYSVSAKFDRSLEPGLLLDDLMDGLYRYVGEKKLRACIVLDEFQEITGLPESKKIEGILRSHIQLHQEIAYVYVGSRRGILQDMFLNRSRPFYKSASLYVLNEIPRDDFVSHIGKKFMNTGKACPTEIAILLYDITRGYPYYVQKLASIAWDRTEKECDEHIVKEAYDHLIAMESIDYEGIWNGLTLVQKSVLSAIAKEPILSPYSREFLERYHLTVGGTQRAMKVLLSRDLIEKDSQHRYRLTDPIMEAWLKR